jgi:peptide/nickel transport system substrate-binding protein
MSRVVFAGTLAGFIATPLACAPRAPTGQRLRLSADVQAAGLNPYAQAVSGIDELAWLYADGLLSIHDGRLVPLLARRLPEVSGDGRTLTYELRPNVRWHDGSALTAADVRDAYDSVARSPWGFSHPYRSVRSIQVLDTHQFSVRFDAAYPGIAASFFAPSATPALPVLKPSVGLPIGTGPFYVSRTGDPLAFRLDAWRQSPRGTPLLDRIDVRLVDSSAASDMGVIGHDTDVAISVARDVLERYSPQFQLHQRTTSVTLLTANFSGVLGDAALRAAVFGAIDMARIRRKVYRIASDPKTIFTSGDTYGAELGVAGRAERRAAGHYLAAHPNRFELRIVVPAGKLVRVALLVQSDLKQSGISSRIQSVALESVYLSMLRSGDFDLAVLHPGYVRFDASLVDDWSCAARAPAGANLARVCDPQLDRAFRGNDARAALRRLYSLDAFRPIVSYTDFVAVSPRVHGFAPPSGVVPVTLQCTDWSIE